MARILKNSKLNPRSFSANDAKNRVEDRQRQIEQSMNDDAQSIEQPPAG